MYFHESLPAALDVCVAHGLSLDQHTLFVRDTTGRLTLARVDIERASELQTQLKTTLKHYAATVPLVTGSLAARLLADPNARPVETELKGETVSFRFIDRRLVGADWLLDPARPAHSQPRRLVFASLKGGVGRSTALTVLSSELARLGLSVLAVDLDLEAPGIGFMLLPASDEISGEDRRPRFGVVDYLVENGIDSLKDEDLVDFISPSPHGASSIDVIPAVGRETDDRPHTMIQKLSRALVEDVVDCTVVPVWKQIDQMLSRFESRRSYDVVLIDARAGLSEITAAPLMGLGAHVLLFGTNQQQTFRSYRYLLSNLAATTDFRRMTSDIDWRPRLSFVQAKAPAVAGRRSSFRDRIFDLCSEFLYEEDIDGFSFDQKETGIGVPHDAMHIIASDTYMEFDPLTDPDQLDPEAYTIVFGTFLRRVKNILGLE